MAARAVRSVAVLVLVGGVISPAVTQAAMTPERAQAAMAATVLVKVDRLFRNQAFPTSGSGFFISARGHILTNSHVVSPQIELRLDGRFSEVSTTIGGIEVVIGGGSTTEQTVPAKLIAQDRDRDLALLQVTYRPQAWLDVSGARPRLAIMDQVWAVGFPFGEALALNKRNPEATLTRGNVTSMRHDEQGRVHAFQVDAAINPGSSGGPLLNDDGEVAGVVYAGVAGGTGTAFALAPERLSEFIAANQVRVRVMPPVVHANSQPLRVDVQPGLVDVEGLVCRAIVRGDDIETVEAPLTPAGGGYAGTIYLPEPNLEKARPDRYLLSLKFLDSGGAQRFTRSFAIPVRPAEPPKLSADRAAAEVMADRVDHANTASSASNRTLKTDGSGDVVSSRSALAQAAASIKLRKSEGEQIVLGNGTLNEVGFVVDPVRYARLPEALREIAVEFDRQEWKTRADRSQAGQAGLLALSDKARRAGLCRFPDGGWSLTREAANRTACRVPAP